MIRPGAGLPAILLAGFLAACATQEPVDPRAAVPEAMVQRALESLESGHSIRWRDPSTGEAGTITPVRTFRIDDDRFCRDYEVSYQSPGGKTVTWTETACRHDQDGWRKPDTVS